MNTSQQQISHCSQREANLKYENFPVSYHSHTTLLPQNNLQLQID